jgi:hypothetical protein
VSSHPRLGGFAASIEALRASRRRGDTAPLAVEDRALEPRNARR